MSQDVPEAKTTRILKMFAKGIKYHRATSALKKSVYWLLYLKVKIRKKKKMVIKLYSPKVRQKALEAKLKKAFKQIM